VPDSEHADRAETHSPTLTSLFFALSSVADPRKRTEREVEGRGWEGGGSSLMVAAG